MMITWKTPLLIDVTMRIEVSRYTLCCGGRLDYIKFLRVKGILRFRVSYSNFRDEMTWIDVGSGKNDLKFFVY